MTSETALSGPLAESDLMRSLEAFTRRYGLQSLVLGPSKDPNAKITVLLVSGERGRPVYAVKVPTTDLAQVAVDTEHQMLEHLLDVAPPLLLHTVPRVIDTVDVGGRRALITTALPGRSLATSVIGWRHTANPDRVGRDFEAVERWLDRLHGGTATGSDSLDLDGGTIGRLRRRFATEVELRDDTDRLAAIYGRLAESATPRAVVHGDMWSGNVLLQEGQISGVVDWEACAPVGEPVRDLVRFAHMYALFLDRRTRNGGRVAGHRGLRATRWGAGVDYALDGEGWFPDLVRGFLQRGLRRLHADETCWRDCALAGIAEVAATTDDEDFARNHLELFRRLARTTPKARCSR